MNINVKTFSTVKIRFCNVQSHLVWKFETGLNYDTDTRWQHLNHCLCIFLTINWINITEYFKTNIMTFCPHYHYSSSDIPPILDRMLFSLSEVRTVRIFLPLMVIIYHSVHIYINKHIYNKLADLDYQIRLKCDIKTPNAKKMSLKHDL